VKNQGFRIEDEMIIANLVNKLFYFYFLLIILRVFLTWIPNLDWYAQPAKFLRDITDPYLDFFKNFIPPFGGIDFSPIIALLVLQIIQIFLTNIIAAVIPL
jgi:YggT family protein